MCILANAIVICAVLTNSQLEADEENKRGLMPRQEEVELFPSPNHHHHQLVDRNCMFPDEWKLPQKDAEKKGICG